MTTLEVQERDITGKKVAKLREEGKIPAVLYGPKLKKSVSVLIDKVDFEKTWKDA
ncbi:MAG: 50S ribosomal protein L25, partial [bacterium]|nr:50S ribosomal protein L25 [bacterium]